MRLPMASGSLPSIAILPPDPDQTTSSHVVILTASCAQCSKRDKNINFSSSSDPLGFAVWMSAFPLKHPFLHVAIFMVSRQAKWSAFTGKRFIPRPPGSPHFNYINTLLEMSLFFGCHHIYSGQQPPGEWWRARDLFRDTRVSRRPL